MDDYREFLRSKLARHVPAGFDPAPYRHLIPAGTFGFQAAVAEWACRLGRAAVFAECGMGKSLIQLAWASLVHAHAGGRVLVLTPLAVAAQTASEAARWGLACRHARSGAEAADAPVLVTNYERLHLFDPAAFVGVVLDESSILKAFTGKTKQRLCEAFAATPYRLCCTATPSPNDHMELGNHSAFLGVMPSDEMLTRWFINDTMETGSYRLKGHAAADFWRWVSSWAVCLSKPSDLGPYPDDGYLLPPLDLRECVVPVDVTAGAGGRLFRCDGLSATTLHREMRRTAPERAAAAAALVRAAPGRPWVVWCNTNYEADELTARLPEAVEVRGGDPKAEDKLAAFARGDFLVLVTKPSICGFGLNWQHVRDVAFVGLSYSFEDYYQALRRSWRFGQTEPVRAYLVYAETEGEVLSAVKAKQARFDAMRDAMVEAAGRHFREDAEALTLKEVVPWAMARGKGWALTQGDCVEYTRRMGAGHVDFTIFSPPFSNLYVYSDALADMGNAADADEFFKHFGYLIPELLRVTREGRLCAVHCKDLPLYRGRDGEAGLWDFPGEIVRRFTGAGWTFHSRVTIWKDPVIEQQRTKNNGLLHKTLCRDSSQVRQGMADYLLVFRKPPRDGLMSERPVGRPHCRDGCFERYVGSAGPVAASKYARAGEPERGPGYGLAVWQRYASPVWFDIDQTDVLNHRIARSDQDEKHICPLQLQVIERAVELWTSPGDVVFSPFAGVGSELYVALKARRRAIGVELKPEYFRLAAKHCEEAEALGRRPTLFDEAEPPEAAAR